MKKRDLMLLTLAAIIIAVLLAAPPETTHRIPFDDTHQRFYSLIRTDGKKAAETFCQDCHNPQDVPFPADHPPKFRCLFCHKLEQQ